MVPVNYNSLAIPGKSVAQAVQIYFDSQYPNTNNCSQLDAQISNITADLVQINKNLFSNGLTYRVTCKKLWEAQLTLKKKQRGSSTCTNVAAVVPAVAQPAAVTTPETPASSNPLQALLNPAPATAPSTVTSTVPISVANLSNPNPSVTSTEPITGAPKNPNAPDGSGSSAATNATAAATKPDYFSKKNLMIGGGVIALLTVVGILVSKKHKKAKD